MIQAPGLSRRQVNRGVNTEVSTTAETVEKVQMLAFVEIDI